MARTYEKKAFTPECVPEILKGTAFMEEAGADTFEISDLPFTPAGVLAHVLRSDDVAIAVDGTYTGGKAVVTLDADCYHVAGRLSVAIYITDSLGNSQCVYACIGNVYRTVGDTELDSGTEVPTLAQLEAAYAACISATQQATNAVSYETQTGKTDAQKLQARTNIGAVSEDDFSDLKSAASVTKESDAEDVDLDISDSEGNVIARFSGGGIQVKNFDSGDVGDLSDLTTTAKGSLVEAINEAAESGGQETPVQVSTQATDGNADLYVADLNGRGLVRFADGNIQTKGFNSDNSEYKQTFAYTNTSGKEIMNRFFPAGTVLAFHLVQNNVAGSETIGQYLITYGYTDKENVGHTLGQEYGYNYFTAKLPEDAVNVYASYGVGLLWNESGTLAFSVFSEANYARKPIVVTVSPDGTKDYTSLRAAVDDIKLLASDFTPYEIHIYPGTYNLMGDYTDTEISAEGFKGLFITNGISVIGQGERSEIVLSAELSTDDYTSEKRNDVSTLNLKGNIRLENLTVIAKNIRYCIHDDSGSMVNKRNVRVLRNVKLRGYNLTTVFYTYGAGGGNGKVIKCYDCDFTHAFHVHNTSGQNRPYRVLLENCTAKRFTFADYANVNTPSMVTMNNCKCSFVEISAAASGQAQTLFVNGVGTYGAMYDCPEGYVYCLGDCIALDDGQIAAGYAVKLSASDYKKPPVIATSVNSVYGISLGIVDNTTIVQTSGYISSKTLGMSGLSVGDYLTIDTSTGEVVSGGTEETAIAKVTYVDSNGTAFAKLTI